MARSKQKGGATHVRYGHRSRARDLDVVCPRCAGRAVATQASTSDVGAVMDDLHPSWGRSDWTVACSRCPYRGAELAYEELPPLFWTLVVRGLGVWGWNRDHLAFVAALLEGQDVAASPYAWFATYVPGAWKRDGARIARAIGATLEAAPSRSHRGSDVG